MRKFKGLLILVPLLVAQLSTAQSVVSPYSILGVGDLSFDGLVHNQAIGELGVGYNTVWHINHRNPAWLYRNTFSTFQVAVEGESRRFATTEQTENSATGGLRYLAIAFPIKSNRLSSSFGILPYSTVNYNITTNNVIDGTDVNVSSNLRGEGGLTQAFFSTGLRLGKKLGLGMQVKYIFGNITTSNGVIVNDETIVSAFQTRFSQNTSYSDVNLLGGLSYKQKLSEKGVLNIGLTYDLSTGLSGDRVDQVERRTLDETVVELDTLTTESSVNFTVPNSTSVGIYYEKLNQFGFGIDFSIRNWTDNGGFENSTAELRNAIKIAVGGEYIPTYNDVNSYFKRVTYRAGITYEQLPFLVSGQRINDFGINFGSSFPVGGFSSLDVALKIGQRGTTENELIRETYFKFVFGATINDRWFIRRKYD